MDTMQCVEEAVNLHRRYAPGPKSSLSRNEQWRILSQKNGGLSALPRPSR